MPNTAQALTLVSPVGNREAADSASLTAGVFDDWIRLYYEDVYRFVTRFVGTEEAADLTQDCFVKAFRARKTFRGDCAPKTWLIRIAVNTCRDWLRRQRRNRALFVDMEDESVVEAAREDRFNPLAFDVKRCMARLDYEAQTMLVLRFVEGLSFAEVGEAHGCSEAAAKMKVHRAKNKLRWMIERGR